MDFALTSELQCNSAGKTLEEVIYIFEDPNGIKNIGTPAWKTKVDRKRILKVERHGSADIDTGLEEGEFAAQDRKTSNLRHSDSESQGSGTRVGDTHDEFVQEKHADQIHS